jgi:energy-coupling factor transport system substrate-specific component
MAMRGWYRTIWKAAVSGFVGELVQVPIGTPIAVLLFGGITTGSSSMVTAFFMATGRGIWESVILGGIFIDGADKVLSAIIAFLIIKALPKRTLYRFSRAPFTVLGETESEAVAEEVPA